ncbi:ABC transporter ATP-binding protein [bacterium]|nr:ABC transporter ATP-binding protein [bacterium]
MNKLTLKGLGKVFNGEDGREIEALRDINVGARSGEFICIIGSTGCGKTTLLRLIAGLTPMSTGQVLLDDKLVENLNRDCTLVFQQLSLFPWFSVQGNIEFPLELKGVDKSEREARVKELLKMVGLEGVANSKPYELSGGMQQRIAIARALAYDPEILLMDEPFGALDEKTRQKLQNVLLEVWKKKKKTILFVTHNIDEAIVLADRIIVMAPEPGRIINDIEVTLPRKRDRLTNEFIKLHIEIRNLLEVSD